MALDEVARECLREHAPQMPDKQELGDTLLSAGGFYNDGLLGDRGLVVPAIRTYYGARTPHIVWHFMNGREDAPDEKTDSSKVFTPEGTIRQSRRVIGSLMVRCLTPIG